MQNILIIITILLIINVLLLLFSVNKDVKPEAKGFFIQYFNIKKPSLREGTSSAIHEEAKQQKLVHSLKLKCIKRIEHLQMDEHIN